MGGQGYGHQNRHPCFRLGHRKIDALKCVAGGRGCPRTAKRILYDGRTGEPFDNSGLPSVSSHRRVTHMVDDKIQALSTGLLLAGHPATPGRLIASSLAVSALGEMGSGGRWKVYGAAYTLFRGNPHCQTHDVV